MRYIKLLILFLTLVTSTTWAQTTVNLRSLKTHHGNLTWGSGYAGNANDHAEFDNMVNLNSTGTTLHVDTTVDILSLQGPRGNSYWNPPKWSTQRFAIVYTGWVKPNKTGNYSFRTYTDDSHEFMIKGLGYTDDIITKHYGYNTWNTRTGVYLDKDTWYEFEMRIQNYGGAYGAQFQYKIPNGSQFNQLGGNNYSNGSSHPFGEWSATDPNADPITASGYIKGAEEQGLSGVTVKLLTQNKNQPGFSYTEADSVITDSNGYYSFNTNLNYNDYDFTINIYPELDLPITADINWFTNRLLTGPISSKDYWRMDVNNSGDFSVSDIFLMHQMRQGNITSYPGFGQTLWNTNYWQQPYVWDAVKVDTDDKTLFPGYGQWSLFDLTNGNQTTFYVIGAGHKN